MKKMTLDLDSLAVESFDTSSAGLAERGTVWGHNTLVQPVISAGGWTACLCPPTSVCILSVDYQTCVVTTCNDVTCTCQPATGASCDEESCRWTHCDWTCNINCD